MKKTVPHILTSSWCLAAILLTSMTVGATGTKSPSTQSEAPVVFPGVYLHPDSADLKQNVIFEGVPRKYFADENEAEVTVLVGKELQRIFGNNPNAPYNIKVEKANIYSKNQSFPSSKRVFCKMQLVLDTPQKEPITIQILTTENALYGRNENLPAAVSKAFEKAMFKLIDRVQSNLEN